MKHEASFHFGVASWSIPEFFSRGDQVAGLRNHRGSHEAHQNPRGIFMEIFMEIFMGYLWEYLGIFMEIFMGYLWRYLWDIYGDIYGNIWGYLWRYSWDIYGDICGIFMGIFMEIFMGYLWRYSWGYLWRYSWDIYGNIWGYLWRYSWDIYGDIYGIFMGYLWRYSWDIYGNIWGYLWRYSWDIYGDISGYSWENEWIHVTNSSLGLRLCRLSDENWEHGHPPGMIGLIGVKWWDHHNSVLTMAQMGPENTLSRGTPHTHRLLPLLESIIYLTHTLLKKMCSTSNLKKDLGPIRETSSLQARYRHLTSVSYAAGFFFAPAAALHGA